MVTSIDIAVGLLGETGKMGGCTMEVVRRFIFQVASSDGKQSFMYM